MSDNLKLLANALMNNTEIRVQSNWNSFYEQLYDSYRNLYKNLPVQSSSPVDWTRIPRDRNSFKAVTYGIVYGKDYKNYGEWFRDYLGAWSDEAASFAPNHNAYGEISP